MYIGVYVLEWANRCSNSDETNFERPKEWMSVFCRLAQDSFLHVRVLFVLNTHRRPKDDGKETKLKGGNY
jgi:hypothetical protein